MTDVKIKVNLFLFYIYGWEKMCKNCSDLTIRLECIIWSIAEIVFSVAFIGFICGRHEVHNIILLAALSLGILAGFCLLLGAILRKRFLVLTWIVLICPTIVIVISMSCLILKENWNFLPGFDKARKIIALIIIVGSYTWYIYHVYLFAKSRREKGRSVIRTVLGDIIPEERSAKGQDLIYKTIQQLQ
ncbi:uncharacterized protein LOC110191946 isoform X2 [Drosophila serrata]|uniref:uncharacterized protein LOC110191946 isoform X2 n=1 Tax=Drosophila serrata TaxID=7274 RepID=UPI000A1D07A7|nr:uncharacterized protein LOC110191946 isoform X2 [Drosophila serrata]